MPARILITFLSFFLDLVGKLSYLINIKTAIALRAIALSITLNRIRNNLMSNQSEPLSRRDQIAIAAMQVAATDNRLTTYQVAVKAVRLADELIKALDIQA